MIHIRIFSVGKTKESWLQEALEMYETRLKGKATITLILYKDQELLEKALLSHKESILLDPQGREYASEEFSAFLFQEAEKQGASIIFGIGGADGFSQDIQKKLPKIRLSRMTFTHQITRLVLYEQIFRAFEIEKGSGYHK